MEFNTIQDLRAAGFQGLVKLSEVGGAMCDKVPSLPGVYLVARYGNEQPLFLKESVGGHFKGKDPTVSRDELMRKWVDCTIVVYLGKAGGTGSSTTLRTRIARLQQFGNGKAVSHWGGRYLWQLQDFRELIVAWLPTLRSKPRQVECALLNEFSRAYGGRLPFANLVK